MPKQIKTDKKVTKLTKLCGSCKAGCGCMGTMMKNASKETKFAYILILILFIIVLISGTSDKTIKAWVNKNPEVILESVNKFVAEKQREMIKERQKMATEGIKTKKDELYDTKYSGVVNPKGSVTIIEFFDYNCGYCKHVSKTVEKIAQEDKKVRVIFKELPILGESSRYAAKVAIAVAMVAPDRYIDFHAAMMAGNAQTKDGVETAVKKAGIKFSSVEDTLRAKNNKIEEVLNANLQLASEIGINGTPAFIVNDELVPGAIDEATLKEMINKTK